MPDSAELKNRGLKATLPRLQFLGILQAPEPRHLSKTPAEAGVNSELTQ